MRVFNLFPRGITGAIVSYAPSLNVTIFMPAQKITVETHVPNTDWEELYCKACPHFKKPCAGGYRVIATGNCVAKVTPSNSQLIDVPAPPTAMIQSYSKIDPKHNRADNPFVDKATGTSFKLFAFNGIACAHLSLGNVYDNGEICWGQASRPLSLRLAWNGYWATKFNSDLTRRSSEDEDVPYRRWLSNYKPNFNNQASGVRNLIAGTARISTQQPVQGFLYIEGFREEVNLEDMRLNGEKRFFFGWVTRTVNDVAVLDTGRGLYNYYIQTDHLEPHRAPVVIKFAPTPTPTISIAVPTPDVEEIWPPRRPFRDSRGRFAKAPATVGS
jgi:hypothetical protein